MHFGHAVTQAGREQVRVLFEALAQPLLQLQDPRIAGRQAIDDLADQGAAQADVERGSSFGHPGVGDDCEQILGVGNFVQRALHLLPVFIPADARINEQAQHQNHLVAAVEAHPADTPIQLAMAAGKNPGEPAPIDFGLRLQQQGLQPLDMLAEVGPVAAARAFCDQTPALQVLQAARHIGGLERLLIGMASDPEGL